MISRHMNIILAVIFLIVGILATANTVRLNTYIGQTMPRDAAQEICNARTIEVLKAWLGSRSARDNAMDARDNAAVAVLDRLTVGQTPSPGELGAWRDAVARDRAVRAAVGEQNIPLPNC